MPLSGGKIATSNQLVHLPDLAAPMSADQHHRPDKLQQRKGKLRSSVQTQTSTSSGGGGNGGSLSNCSSGIGSGSSRASSFDLPPVLLAGSGCGGQAPNSALVHQRAAAAAAVTAADHLAAAAARAGASLPLMIGNRSKCVVNLLDAGDTLLKSQEKSAAATASAAAQAAALPGPQNTALRAEQRRQHASVVSVVRPVVSVAASPSQARVTATLPQGDLERKSSRLLDEWMALEEEEEQKSRQLKHSVSYHGAGGGGGGSLLDELQALQEDLAHYQQHGSQCNGKPMEIGFHSQSTHKQQQQQQQSTEQELRQRAALLRREEHELARGVRRQHQFVVCKLEERRRQLAIIQSVWAQRDFKLAMEKLVDIYQQGLVFTNTATAGGATSRLRSLNTALAVDVLNMITLRPRLWTLDICQLLLPIINQDLLVAPTGAQLNSATSEHYVEVALRALRLILVNFSGVIRTTLESLKDSGKLVGVDLSREDRINKCLACYALLLDSRAILAKGAPSFPPPSENPRQTPPLPPNKLAAQQRELATLFASLFASLPVPPEPNIPAARRLQTPASGGGGGVS